ncbi:MAG TPA: AraC family transcriptional regulator [Desulfobacteraceae bacterium]|nr:AraC family transcriptional regulator [Desulfobacteraceae bacterium]
MTAAIPQVFFHKPLNADFQFEAMPLKRLFERSPHISPALNRPHRVEFYQILYITEGRGRHYIDFTSYEYCPGSLMFIAAGQVHAFEVKPENEGFLLLFTEEFLTRNISHSEILPFSRLFNYHLYPPDIQPVKALTPVFDAIFSDIHNEYIFTNAFAREEIIRTLLKLLMLKAERLKQTLAPAEIKADWLVRFNAFRKLLSVRYTDTRNADAYADMMHMSYTHLNRIIKTVTGNTAKAFIDSFVIMEAKRHLAVSDASIKELSYIMGFDEPTNFVKYFKKQTGRSPAQFRRTLTA